MPLVTGTQLHWAVGHCLALTKWEERWLPIKLLTKLRLVNRPGDGVYLGELL